MKTKSIFLILSINSTALSCGPPQQSNRSYTYSSDYLSADSAYSQDPNPVVGRSGTVQSDPQPASTPSRTDYKSPDNDDLSSDLRSSLSRHKPKSIHNDDNPNHTLTDPPVNRRPKNPPTYKGIDEGVGVGLLWGATIVVGGIGAGEILSNAELAAIIHTELPAAETVEYEIANIIHGYAREFQDLEKGRPSTPLTGIATKGHFINSKIFNIKKWCDVEVSLNDLDEDTRENTAGMFSKPALKQIEKLKKHARRVMLREYSKLLSQVGQKHPTLPDIIQPCFDGAVIPLDTFIVCFDWIQDNTTDRTTWTNLAEFLDNPPSIFAQALKEIFP